MEERGHGMVNDEAFAPANSHQVATTAAWLADKIVHDAWSNLSNLQELEISGQASLRESR